MEEMASLFAPGMKHVQEEKQRLVMTRDDEATGDPPSSVDLDGNRAVIRLPVKADQPDAVLPPPVPRGVRPPQPEPPTE
jgi:hypothetical protein